MAQVSEDEQAHKRGLDYVVELPDGTSPYSASLAAAKKLAAERGGRVMRLRVGSEGRVECVPLEGAVGQSKPDLFYDADSFLFDVADRLKLYQQAYHDGKPVVSDATYDMLESELAQKDPTHPVLRKVGAPVAGQKVKHDIAMGSLHKVQNEPDACKWFAAKVRKTQRDRPACFVSEKLDGASLSLRYENGRFVQALTRGDGEHGEDVTDNVRLCQGFPLGIPPELRQDFTGHVRGEVLVRLSDFEAHFPDMANPRNAAAGMIRNRKDAVRCRHLTVFAYKIVPDGFEYKDRLAEFDLLGLMGFSLPRFWSCDDATRLVEVYQGAAEFRARLDYEIDGLVVEVNDNTAASEFGVTDGRPNAAVAWKFPHQTAETVLRDVVWQVGSTGRVTPVAVFDPVQVAGASVNKASLANEARLQELALRQGSKVLVARRNDVIPRVEDNLEPGTGVEFSAPENCPACAYSLVRDGAYLMCPNVGVCPDQVQGSLQRWLDKIGVLDWGDAVLEALVRDGVKDPADLYLLPEWKLAELVLPSGRKLGVSNARTMVKNLNAKRDLPLHVFVGALGIPLCGRTTCKTLVDAGFDTLDKLRAVRVFELVSIPGVGPHREEAFLAGFAERWPVVQKLLQVGVRVREVAEGVMKGKSMCMTGFRDGDMAAEFERQGGTVKSGVSKGLTYLVQKDPNSASAKSEKAKEYGTRVVGIEEMRNMLRGAT